MIFSDGEGAAVDSSVGCRAVPATEIFPGDGHPHVIPQQDFNRNLYAMSHIYPYI